MDSLSFRSISIQAKLSITKIIYSGDISLKEALQMIVNFKLKLYKRIKVYCNGKNIRIRKKYKSNINWRLQLICSIQAS